MSHVHSLGKKTKITDFFAPIPSKRQPDQSLEPIVSEMMVDQPEENAFHCLSEVLRDDNLCDLMKDNDTFVYYKYPYVPGTVPVPLSRNDSYSVPLDHVKLPFQDTSSIEYRGEKLPRWAVILKAYRYHNINGAFEFEKTIKIYNPHLAEDQFDIFTLYFNHHITGQERQEFFQKLLPKIIRLALDIPKLFCHNLANLDSGTTMAVFLSQQQISCLIANAFLCTFSPPKMDYDRRCINFNSLYCSEESNLKKRRCKLEKLKCMVNYLRRVTEETPKGTVSFERKKSNKTLFAISDKPIANFKFNFDKCLIEDGSDYAQVDFAHKYLGGGVLDTGCVQEEILFLVCPELIAAKLICGKLLDHEAVIITGVEQFNRHTGYADDFKWKSSYKDTLGRDKYGRRFRQILAMDALSFLWRNKKRQYEKENIDRELVKASTAFQPERFLVNTQRLPAIATGNWGCGVYNGDVYLKALIQIIAASQMGRELIYFTYKDEQLKENFDQILDLIRKSTEPITVGKLYQLMLNFAETRAEITNYNLAVYLAMSICDENDGDHQD